MSSTPPVYFGGDGSRISTVHRLQPSSFGALVRETLGLPAVLNVTRAQFHALPVQEQRARKRVPYLTAACYRTSPSHRDYEHATHCNLVTLDIDEPRHAAPFISSPEALAEALTPYDFAAYTTASSLPEKPKIRIVVAAHQLPLGQYVDAVHHIARLLGLPSVTHESKAAVQPMYLPTMFAGEDPIESHPLFASRATDTEQSRFRSQDLLNPTQPGSPQLPPDQQDDALDNLRPTMAGISTYDVAEALSFIDPDCSYPEWLEVASAIRHQFSRAEERESGYATFDLWSSKGKKYSGPEDTRAKWDSLKPTPRGRVPVTLRTLFRRAEAGGWQGSSVASKAYAAAQEWILDPRRTARELLAGGVDKIAAASMVTTMERNTLVNALRDALASMGTKVGASDLRKAVTSQLRKQDRKPLSETPEAQLPRWARGMVYVAASNEFYLRAADQKFSPEVLDNVYGVHLMEGADPGGSGRPVMRPRDYLLNIANVSRVNHYTYDPAHPEQIIVEQHGKRYVNLYLPTYPEPDADDADAAGEVLYQHLDNLIAEPEYAETLLDYMAHCEQKPGEKIRWAVILQGAEGCGKTAIAHVMEAVLGTGNVNILEASMLFSQFNTWATGSQVVALEEIRIVGHNRYEVMNKLKPCISNDTVTINGKHRDLRMNVANNVNYMMFTNYQDAIAITPNDRRYFVLYSSIQEKAQVLELGRDNYFPRLFDTIRHRAPGLRAFLEKRKIPASFKPSGHAPVTRYLAALAQASASPLHVAIADALADGDHSLVQRDLVSTRALRSILETESIPDFTDQQLGSVLREIGYQQVTRTRLDEDRHYLWAPRGKPLTATQATALAALRLKARPADVAALQELY